MGICNSAAILAVSETRDIYTKLTNQPSQFTHHWSQFTKIQKKIVSLQCRFVRYLFNGLRKKSDKMTMKSEIM